MTLVPGGSRPDVVSAAMQRWHERFSLVVLEEDGTISWASEPITDLLGYRADEVVGMNATALLHPDDLVSALAVMEQNVERERRLGESPELRFLYDVRLRARDGSWCTVEMSGVDVRTPEGPISVVLCLRDFTLRRMLDDLLTLVAEGPELQTVLTRAAEVAGFVIPDSGVLIETQTRYATTIGVCRPENLNGEPPAPAADATGLQIIDDWWTVPLSHQRGRIVVRTSQGDPLVYQTIWLGRVAQLVGLAVERAEAEALLRRLALTDPLTSVANRAELAHALERACRQGPVAVAIVDLDHFKAVNDHHGHAVGDAFLVEVARRLRNHVRAGDVVGRLGGDEFAIVCPGLDDLGIAMSLADRLVAALADPVHLDDLLLQAGASVGLVLAPAGSHPQDILRDADEQLYAAKGRGGRCYALGSR